MQAVWNEVVTMTERLPCRTEGCKATILPATAAKTGGYCMPCHQEQKRLERQAYIEAHRKTVNPYEGLTDPVEIIKVMHAPRRYDPLIKWVAYPLPREDLYARLTDLEAAALIDYARELLYEEDTDMAEEVLASLVCYRNTDISDIHELLMNKDIFSTPLLYKDAAGATRDRLFQLAEQDEEHRNAVLLALSWIGDEVVVDRHLEWRSHPPAWVNKLYVQPQEYTVEAGWELTPEGKRRELVLGSAYAIVQKEPADDEQHLFSSAVFMTRSANCCPWCGRRLTCLADVDAAHPSLSSLKLNQERLRIETCEHCGCYGFIYMEADPSGAPVWSVHNQIPDYLSDLPDEDEMAPEAAPLVLSPVPRSPYYGADWALSQQDSQLGGFPGWVQDAEYPVCPCCGRRMTFVGQMDYADFVEYGEGLFYMFVCPDDRMTATVYQQS